MKAADSATLAPLLAAYPQTTAIVDAVLADWPEHEGYISKSMAVRSPALMATTERIATAARRLMDGAEPLFAHDYHLTCDRVREEELFFYREGRYRLSTFAEANAEVYSNHEYMNQYVNGILITQVIWHNHTATYEMFLDRAIGGFDRPFDYLEIGPGHGLGMAFAAEAPLCRSLEAWDVSPTSIGETKAALAKLGVTKPVHMQLTNIMSADVPDRKFDLITISEVLEHLETPDVALATLRKVVAPDGRLFVSIPINSPAPDHIYLVRHPDEVRALIEAAGFEIETMELHATQARDIEAAIRKQMTISAAVLARPR